jgi:hypothetical protein
MAGASALAGSGRTAKAYNIEDLRKMAKRRLPKVIFDYMDGGADDEATLRNNRTAFDKYSLVGRMLVDVSGLSTATTVLGDEMSLPVILSSTGANRLFHTDGELAAARAAAKAGTVFATASSAMTSLEDVAKATDGPNWFQLRLPDADPHSRLPDGRQPGKGLLQRFLVSAEDDTAQDARRHFASFLDLGLPVLAEILFPEH